MLFTLYYHACCSNVYRLISLVDADTSVSGGERTRYSNGESVNLACTVTGAPLPTIIWNFKGMNETRFRQTDSSIGVDLMHTTFRSTDFLGLPYNRTVVVPGIAMSTLHIENMTYPEDDGVYNCIGSNTGFSITATSSVPTLVQIEGNSCTVMLPNNIRWLFLYEECPSCIIIHTLQLPRGTVPIF